MIKFELEKDGYIWINPLHIIAIREYYERIEDEIYTTLLLSDDKTFYVKGTIDKVAERINSVT